MSLMVLSQDHYAQPVVYVPGGYTYTREHIGTRSMFAAARDEFRQALPDGSFTIQFGGCEAKTPHCLVTPSGWSHVVRLYRPRTSILDGTWKLPKAMPAG